MPFVHFVGIVGAALCVFVMGGLPSLAWVRFGWWLVIGLVLYFAYGYRNSTLRRGTGPVVVEPSSTRSLLMQNRPSTAVDPTLGSAASPEPPKSFFPPHHAVAVDRHLDGRRDCARLGVPRAAHADHGGWAATDLNVLSSVFLRMIKSLIVPLLFARSSSASPGTATT